MSSLRPWRELVEPHSDVRKGNFQEAEFAADLSRVHAGTAPAEYQEASLFFQRTYITEGMRLLLHSVLQRLSGKAGDPVIQLQTAFGGGKTHTLLAVYHLAQAQCSPSELPGIPAILDEVGVTELPKAKVAVIDGISLSPNQPVKRGSCIVRTMWGELAWQLAGADGYALVEASDISGTSPSKDILAQLLSMAAPCVILMDELVAYIRQFSEAQLSGGTFATNLSFVQALTEAIKGVPRTVLLASLPQSAKEAGDATGKLALETLAHTFGRVQALWKPVGAEESFEIVRRRLFSNITDRKAADDVCREFADFYRANGHSFPQETQESRYEERLKSAYPIHPEVFARLYEDWSSLDNFQRTRGVLKLMANVIHRLWKDGDSDPLIMPGSIPLYDLDTRGNIIYYLPQGWDPVVDKDIDGENAQPTQIDTDNSRFGSVMACRRVARTIFLGSAPSGNLGDSNVYRGIDEERIFLGAALPASPLGVFKDALGRLKDKLYYLNSGNEKYWFDVRPNLRREMEDRKNRLSPEDATPSVRAILRDKLRLNMFGAVHVFADSSDIPDDETLRLVVLPLRSAAYSRTEETLAIEVAKKILENKGDQQRANRNRLIFLAAEFNNVSRLIEQVKTMLAWKSILNDSQQGKLNLDQLTIKNAKEATLNAESTVMRAVPETFRWLLVPEGSTRSVTEIAWRKYQLQASGKLTDEIERQLRENEAVIEQWAPIHLRNLLRQWYWRDDRTEIPALNVWQDSCKYCFMPRLKAKGTFADTITAGTKSKDFFGIAQGKDGEKFLGFSFGKSTIVVLDSSTLLLEVERATSFEQAQLIATSQPLSANETLGTSSGATGNYGSGSGNIEPPKPSTKDCKKRFYASVHIDPMTGKTDVWEIFDSVIQHLYEYKNSNIRLTLEIDASTETEEGYDSTIQRNVKENCKVLKFFNADFE
ncbi:ATP-binding protein [Mailhella sp.]